MTNHINPVSEQSANLDLARPSWMNHIGADLYNQWTNELLEAAAAPDLWAENLELIKKETAPGVVDGVVLRPQDVLRPIFRKQGGLIRKAEEQTNVSERLLLPRMDEILHYTSARVFMETRGLSKEEAVVAHARDGLRFSMKLAAGLADDVFIASTHPSKQLLNRLFNGAKSLNDGDPQEVSSILETIQGIAGPFWNASLEEPGMEQSANVLERVFGLQRLSFIAQALGNATLQAQLEEFSVTAFGQFGDPSTELEYTKATPKEGESTALNLVYGWQHRMRRFGLAANPRPSKPKSVLSYEPEADTFDVPPKVITHLRDALRAQNRDGLDQSILKSTGNLANLTPPLSVGCPVHNTGAIEASANFAARIFSGIIAFHKEYAIL